jgi:hypothetical protein
VREVQAQVHPQVALAEAHAQRERVQEAREVQEAQEEPEARVEEEAKQGQRGC